MIIVLENVKYAVQFNRRNNGTAGELFHEPGTTTHAELYKVLDGNSLEYLNAHASAYLHPNDRFSKSKGRKIALAKLLKIMGLNKEQRTFVWQVYFEKHNK